MPRTSVLSLGTRKDADLWSATCASALKYTSRHKFTKPEPSLDEIRAFFGGSEEWLYIAGHFTHASHLYNETESVKVRFANDRVTVTHPDKTDVVLKKGSDFQQHKKVKVIFWGGCDVHSSAETVRTMRALFGNPLMIGWHGTTGWQILHSVMGGFGNKPPHSPRSFFDRVATNPADPNAVKDAWLETAADTTWGKPDDSGPAYKKRFSVITPDGTDHRIPGHTDLTS